MMASFHFVLFSAEHAQSPAAVHTQSEAIAGQRAHDLGSRDAKVLQLYDNLFLRGSAQERPKEDSQARARRRRRRAKGRVNAKVKIEGASWKPFQLPTDLSLSEVQRMCFEADGSREVQRRLQCASDAEAGRLSHELFAGLAAYAATCPHANYALQKAIQVSPLSTVPFVAEELRASDGRLVFHEYACRIYCRVIEMHPAGRCVDGLLRSHVFSNLVSIINGEWSRHVACTILQYGCSEHRAIVEENLRARVAEYAKSRRSRLVLRLAASVGVDLGQTSRDALVPPY
jgi:hypothetical protein